MVICCFLNIYIFSHLSNQVEGDVKEEILQPPEPHPVPPILTPSPPSAFPTVTNVRQDNDRYHPKPILHVLASDQNPDLNENYTKPREDSPAPPALTTQPPTPSPGEGLDTRLDRKLSIEIKKVPLQEGPRSFDGNGALQRSHAFKRSNTSSSSMSEDSDDAPRPNHLPLRAEKGQAAWSLPSPDKAAERTPSPSLSSAASGTPVRTALSFTNPLHSDFTDAGAGGGDGTSGRSSISMATSTVSLPQQGDHAPRRVTTMSIAGHSLLTETDTSTSLFHDTQTHFIRSLLHVA